MAGNKHPIPIAIVDRLRIAFNNCYSLEGREFARREAPSVVYEGNAHERAALCAAIRDAKREKVTGSRMNAEKLMMQWFPFYGFARQACSNILLIRSKITCIDDLSWNRFVGY
jgi:hypothetical protein